MCEHHEGQWLEIPIEPQARPGLFFGVVESHSVFILVYTPLTVEKQTIVSSWYRCAECAWIFSQTSGYYPVMGPGTVLCWSKCFYVCYGFKMDESIDLFIILSFLISAKYAKLQSI